MSDARDRELAEAVVRRVGGNRATVLSMIDDIAGQLSPGFHRAVVAMLPPALGVAFGGPSFDARVHVEGDLAGLRELATRTTLIVAPTHSSNLDSVVLGMVLGRAGLPPFAYAAGKHIYRNRLFAALMFRLGAFRLDPDRRDRLYLRVVQTYVNELVARGTHTVVFPSGTRCRSGEIESSVKLGLLGASVQVARPIALVPVTINYQVVLEAEWLIAYHLAGRSHERIVGDELFVWGRLGDTARRLARLDQRVAIHVGSPIAAPGDSWRQRLVAALAGAYRRGVVFFATHVVARALFDGGADEQPIAQVQDAIAATRQRLDRDPALGHTCSSLASASPTEILDAALRAWGSWHRTPV
ncbi:MAG TPA: 1-acyl-sn-glycerol-3-phosphate acyltransferase, partial [Polyangia bacterium]|nr:1-acyl-sn-glycerol-3-phosphate acyltransferase [Polyangia bacterium]